MANFLWLSDVGLILTGVAFWLESSLLISMVGVGILIPELAWNIDFLGRLITGKSFLGITGYMFDKSKPLYLRSLSLFHVFLPIIVLYMLYILKYDEHAIEFQTILCWFLFLIIYFFTNPEENINWVFGPGSKPQNKIPQPLYLIILMILFPLVIFVPMHFLLKWLF